MNAPLRAKEDPARERLLFGLLLLLQTSIYAWLILGHRIVKGHDTLSEYLFQYLFLAHSCQNPDLAAWLPCSLHGVASNWIANFQGGLLQNVLLLVGGVPEGTNMLPLFYAGMFLDEVVLLVGTWSLARRYYASPYTRFFVTAAVVGSTFWATQFSFNFKLFIAIPLLLSLIHQFLDHGRRWPLFLAGNVAALQFSGSITYVPSVTLLVVLVYFLVHAWIFPAVWSNRIRGWRPRPADVLIVLVNAAVLIAVFAVFAEGASAIHQYRPGRDAHAGVTLDAFLTYAGTLSPGRYADLLFGATPSLDYTLYCGVVVPSLALAALLGRPGKPVLHLVICLLLILFFSMGFLSPVAAAAYELVPPLRYFRYVALTAPLVKLFLILLSGYGFEALLDGKLWQTRLMKAVLVPGLVALGGVAVLMLLVRRGGEIPSILGTGSSGLANRGEKQADIPVACAGVFSLLFTGAMLIANRSSRGAVAWMALLLVLQTADVFRWKVTLLHQETVGLDDAQYALQEIRPLPFSRRRSADYDASERYRVLRPAFSGRGAQYEFFDGYFHVDPPLSRYMLLFWMQPLESLIQAGNGRPPDQELRALPELSRRHLGEDPARPGDPYAKIIGITRDKIQVFREAYVPGSDQALADLLNHPDFRGDVLLLSPGVETSEPSRPLSPEQVAANERIDVRPEILHFDMNILNLKVELPPGPAGGWLFYSDVWNPGWTATVNGKPAPVRRAFLAYKAVRLEPGANVVRFEFRAPVRIWAYRLVGLSSLFFIVSLVILTLRLQSDP